MRPSKQVRWFAVLAAQQLCRLQSWQLQSGCRATGCRQERLPPQPGVGTAGWHLAGKQWLQCLAELAAAQCWPAAAALHGFKSCCCWVFEQPLMEPWHCRGGMLPAAAAAATQLTVWAAQIGQMLGVRCCRCCCCCCSNHSTDSIVCLDGKSSVLQTWLLLLLRRLLLQHSQEYVWTAES